MSAKTALKRSTGSTGIHTARSRFLLKEEEKIIAQGNAPLNDDGTFVRDRVKSRQDADYPVVAPDEIGRAHV